MNIARIAVFGIAIFAGLVAFVLSRGEAPEPPPEVVEIKHLEVLVASTDISMGDGLSESDLQWQRWPESFVASNFITRDRRPDALEKFSEAVARQSFVRGEPINEAKLVFTGRGFMSAILPKGMRAIATEISEETGAGGFILPNDRVDVILTQQLSELGDSEDQQTHTSRTILSNVRTLAIDQTIEEKNGRQVVVGRTATLELRPEQAEILALAEQMGSISLALRSLADADSNSGPTASALFDAEEEEEKESDATVRIMKFGRSTQVTTQ